MIISARIGRITIMNCPKCGSLLPQGAQFCNICNEPVSQPGYIPYAPTQQGYPNTPGYPPVYGPGFDPMQAQSGQPVQGYAGQPAPSSGFQQNYAQYANQQTNYPQGYQPIYGGYHPAQNQREPGQFLAALTQIPRTFVGSFRDPGAALRDMMERRDKYAPPVVCGLALLLAFFCGMAATRALVTVFVNFAANLQQYGNELARADGINRIAGSVRAAVGGIAVLGQLLAMIFPLAVMLVYLCAVCKVRFSMDLFLGLITLLTMPTLPASVFTLVSSLFSPILPLLFMAAGMVIAYVFMGSLTARVTGKPDGELVRVKVIMILLSMVLTFAFIALVVGLLSGGVVTTILSYINRR